MVKFIPGASPFLIAYGIVWKLALPVIATLIWLDSRARQKLRFGFLPLQWRMRERLEAMGPALELAEQLGPGFEAVKQNTLWLHAASLGEAKGLWGLVRYLVQAEDPRPGPELSPDLGPDLGPEKVGDQVLPTSLRIILTANTSAGREFLEQACAEFITMEWKWKGQGNGKPNIFVAMAPLDHPSVVRDFLHAWRVRTLVLYEAEMWPHYVRISAVMGVPIFLVSARMSKSAFSVYRYFPRACSCVLGSLAWIHAQTDRDRVRFQSLTVAKISTGFDFKAAYYLDAYSPGSTARVPVPKSHPGRCRLALVSIHYAELRLLSAELPFLFAAFDLIIIPRKLQELSRIRRLLEPFWKPMGFGLYSTDPKARNILVDALGQVATLLPWCRIAFVGGSLIPVGCHNLWEPLMAGLKIYFGPWYGNQAGLAELLRQRGIAEVVTEVSQVRSWSEPGQEVEAACLGFLKEGQVALEMAQAECKERIFATLSPEFSRSEKAPFLRGS